MSAVLVISLGGVTNLCKCLNEAKGLDSRSYNEKAAERCGSGMLQDGLCVRGGSDGPAGSITIVCHGRVSLVSGGVIRFVTDREGGALGMVGMEVGVTL